MAEVGGETEDGVVSGQLLGTGQDLRELGRFLSHLNVLLDRRPGFELTATSNPWEDCDSLEIVLTGFILAEQGVELPPGIEAGISSIEELHQHMLRRLESEHRI